MKKLLVLLLVASLVACSMVPALAEKDTLVVSAIADVESYDPNSIIDYDMMVMSSVFDTLVKYDADGNPAPCLAESWEENGMEVTMHLRQGVKFHDGTDFNADAVMKNYDYHMNGEYGPSFETYAAAIEKVDDYTVKFTKATSYASLIEYCCAYLYIVSPAAYEADPANFGLKPVGTGAYIFQEKDPATGYAYLKANNDYFFGKPGFENLVVRNCLTSDTALIALENKELDIVLRATANDYALAQGNDKLVTGKTTGWNQMTVAMYGEPYISDINLRKAIYYGISRENAAIYHGMENAELSQNLFAKGVMGAYAGQVEIGGYDPEKAAEYLAQSNYHGEMLEMNVQADHVDIATSMQYDLEAIGINTQINPVDSNTWVAKIFDGTAGITLAPLGGSYGGMEELLQIFTSQGYYGMLGIVATDPECDAATLKLAEIPDAAERFQPALDAYVKQVELANFVGLYEEEFYIIYNADLEGVEEKWAASWYPYLYQVKAK